MASPAAGPEASARPQLPPVDARVLERLRTLSARPPQSLVMEGGGAAEREAAALAWARALNCPDGGCGACAVCAQIDGRVFRDLIVADRAYFDEAKQQEGLGPTETIRRLLPVWGQPPHGAGMRVTIFAEAQDLNLAVANLLLKTLEEPRPGNVFVLLAPQRERLLQTLVSRSFVLTLPWPTPAPPEGDTREWLEALLGFWETGRGWFERTGNKGAADRALALRLCAALERLLIAALSGAPSQQAAAQAEPLAARLAARLGPAGLRRLDLALAQVQEALSQPTAPVALVLDWLATAVLTAVPPAAPAPRARLRRLVTRWGLSEDLGPRPRARG